MKFARFLLTLLLASLTTALLMSCGGPAGDGGSATGDDDDSICGDDDDSVTDDDDDDDSATGDDDDSATGDDDDSAAGDDDDSADEPQPQGILQGISFSTDLTQVTSRQTVQLTVEGTYDDGSVWDLSADADYQSSDPSVLKVYVPGIGQPLGAGTTTLSASVGGMLAKANIEITVVLAVASAGDLAINELMINPNSMDISGDGGVDVSDNEFIEVGNAADVSLDLSGVTIFDADNSSHRHVFAQGTVLKPGATIVVFGGGDISALSADNATFVTAANDDDPLAYGLALSNQQDTVRLVAADGNTEIVSANYDPTLANALVGASMTLWDPSWMNGLARWDIH